MGLAGRGELMNGDEVEIWMGDGGLGMGVGGVNRSRLVQFPSLRILVRNFGTSVLPNGVFTLATDR